MNHSNAHQMGSHSLQDIQLAWFRGDWPALSRIDLHGLGELRSEMAPYVVVGLLQVERTREAKELIDASVLLGDDPQKFRGYVLSSVCNSIANSKLIAGNYQDALSSYHAALTLVNRDVDISLGLVRAQHQARLLNIEASFEPESERVCAFQKPRHGIHSHAQNFEDVMLWRALGRIEAGFYIDIGAQHPSIDSVSLAFYKNGWRGMHVEPSIQYSQALRAARSDEMVVEAAVTWRCMPVTLHEISDSGISSIRQDIACQHKKRGFNVAPVQVQTRTLHEIFMLSGRNDIHWMKIDVEGVEAEVLSSWRLDDPRPWILIVESTLPLTQEENYREWEHHLLVLGYDFVYFDGLNRFYLHSSHTRLREAFRSPPNVFDEFVLASSSPFCGRDLRN